MSNALKSPMTPEEFLAWEERQELRWEFDGVRPVAMVGGTAAHSQVQGNLITALTTRLRGKPCRSYGSELKVATGQGRYRYPDGFIICPPLSRDATIATAPIVVFEVLSESTARTDRTVKLIEYRSISSVRRYVLLEQDQALATVITRTEQGWSLDVLRADETLVMPEVGVEVPLAELYIDVELLPPPPDSDEPPGR